MDYAFGPESLDDPLGLAGPRDIQLHAFGDATVVIACGQDGSAIRQVGSQPSNEPGSNEAACTRDEDPLNGAHRISAAL